MMMDVDMLEADKMLGFKVKKAKKPRQKSNPASHSVDLGRRHKTSSTKPILRVSKEEKRNIFLI